MRESGKSVVENFHKEINLNYCKVYFCCNLFKIPIVFYFYYKMKKNPKNNMCTNIFANKNLIQIKFF